MTRRWTLRGSLRAKLLLALLLVIGVGVATMMLAIFTVAPDVFDRLMGPMMGSNAAGGMRPTMQAAVTGAFRTAMLQAVLVGSGAAILAAIGISVFVAERIVLPVRHMVRVSRRIADGHYSERVPAGEPDELGALAEQFNMMAIALEAAERRRVALINDVAHELRTPLATIEGYTEGLLDGVVAPSPETWAVLHDEAGRLRRLVQELQEVSRVEARQLRLHIEPVAPASILTRAMSVVAPQFADKRIVLTSSIPPDLPLVSADADRIVQVVVNLLGNAVRYTPAEGSVSVTAERVDDTVMVQVRDTGSGIAAEHLPLLFERFYRVDPARSRALGGSGIGLSIAKALVETHGGRIWASSPGLGKGATFAFTLPITAAYRP